VARQTRRLLEQFALMNPREQAGRTQLRTTGCAQTLHAAAARWLGLRASELSERTNLYWS
jgi:hypothetical protein